MKITKAFPVLDWGLTVDEPFTARNEYTRRIRVQYTFVIWFLLFPSSLPQPAV